MSQKHGADYYPLGKQLLVLRHSKVLCFSRCQTSTLVDTTPCRFPLLCSYSVFAALLGTQSVLFSKALSLLLRTTIR